MLRTLGAPAALAVLIGVQVLFSPPEPEKPAPAKGALTLDLEGSEGGSKPATVKVTAMGEPPTAPSVLKDAEGEHTASIVEGDAADCPPEKPTLVAIPGGTSMWCLRAEKVDAGHELSGDVKGAGGDTLTLTVHRRDAFLPGPAAWMVLGLLLGLAVILVPAWLRRLVRWIVLNRQLALDRKAPPERKIIGLEDWVRARLLAGATHDEALAAVHEMTSSGPERATDARKALCEHLTKTTLPPDHPFRLEAKEKARLTTHEVGDFYDDLGEKRKQHPAAEWLAGLERMEAHLAELTRREQEIADDIDPDDTAPREKLKQAQTTFRGIDAPSDIARMDERLDALIVAIEDARAKTMSEDERRGWRAGRSLAEADVRERGALETLIPLGVSSGTLAGWTGFAKLAMLLVLVPVVVYAILTVKSAAYDDKLTFDSFNDYFALFSAALGSGVAASVIAMFGYWSAAPEAAADA